ncbi:MAG: HEAT repeat domain-containing protein [Planctomycetes bacterium]|nr:HEAT repeat domain-containing protein [Planctomycetota bacterium]
MISDAMMERASHMWTTVGRRVLVWAVIGVALATFAADGRANEKDPDRVAAVLELLPAETAKQMTGLQAGLARLDAGDIEMLCGMLVAPGTGDDTKPRLALHALTFYVGGPGHEAERGRFVRALGGFLEGDAPTPAKAFLVRQLQLVGDETAVPYLAKQLADEDLCLAVAQTLAVIGGDEAKKTLRDALPEAGGRSRVAIIDALGLLQDHAALPLLRRLADSDDAQTRLAVAWALANQGEEPARDADAGTPASLYSRSRQDALLFRSVERRGEDHDSEQAADWLRAQLVPTPARSLAAHLRCAALWTAAEIGGAAAIEAIVSGIADGDAEVRAAAMNIAVGLEGAGVTEALVAQLREAAVDARAGLLEVLERRGDASALPAAIEALQDQHQAVRLAAVSAAAALGQERALGALVAFLEKAERPERDAVKQALVGMRGAEICEKIAVLLPESAARVQAVLLNVLADRRATGQLDVIFAATTHADKAVRLAAVEAVGDMADETMVPKLLSLLNSPPSACDRDAIEQALSATCNRAESGQRTAPLLAALEPAETAHYCSLLRVLGRVGGAEALRVVKQARGDSRNEVTDAAFRALYEWPDAAAAKDMLSIAGTTEELRHHVLVMRSFARLVGEDESLAVQERLALYQDGMAATRRADERKLLLARLGEVRDGRAVAVLEPYLTDGELAGEAAAALVNVADGLLPAGWADARAALDKVMATCDIESVRQRAAEVERRVAEFEGFVTDWMVAGPYMEKGKNGQEVFDVAFPPEQPGAAGVGWRPQPVTEDPERYWFIDLNRSVAGDNRAGYLRTRVHTPTAQDVVLELGSDDGLKVWLNGEVIHAANVLRGCGRAQDRVPARLEAGWNELLLKVTNNGGGFAASARLRAPNGGCPAGLKIDASAEP